MYPLKTSLNLIPMTFSRTEEERIITWVVLEE
jgi:hypothetical protein